MRSNSCNRTPVSTSALGASNDGEAEPELIWCPTAECQPATSTSASRQGVEARPFSAPRRPFAPRPGRRGGRRGQERRQNERRRQALAEREPPPSPGGGGEADALSLPRIWYCFIFALSVVALRPRSRAASFCFP